MPVYTRKFLRQQLGRIYLHDTLVSTTTGSCGSDVYAYVIDSRRADLSMSSGESGPYDRAYLRVNGMDLRVASFNCGSGAYVTQQQQGTIVPNGAEYEVSELLSPADKDLALSQTAQRLTARAERPIAAVDGAKRYAIPDDVRQVLDAYYLADPTNSLSQMRGRLAWWGLATTGSGREIRIEPAIPAGHQLILDAVTTCTLGSSDDDTIEIPAEEWLLYGAEAACWNLLAKFGPGQETTRYQQNAVRANAAFGRRSSLHAPQIDSKNTLEWPI